MSAKLTLNCLSVYYSEEMEYILNITLHEDTRGISWLELINDLNDVRTRSSENNLLLEDKARLRRILMLMQVQGTTFQAGVHS